MKAGMLTKMVVPRSGNPPPTWRALMWSQWCIANSSPFKILGELGISLFDGILPLIWILSSSKDHEKKSWGHVPQNGSYTHLLEAESFKGHWILKPDFISEIWWLGLHVPKLSIKSFSPQWKNWSYHANLPSQRGKWTFYVLTFRRGAVHGTQVDDNILTMLHNLQLLTNDMNFKFMKPHENQAQIS